MSHHSKQEVNWEFLLTSSKSTLQAFEMSRLNFAANVRKEIMQLLDTWVSESSNALLARYLIERSLVADALSTNPESSLNELKEQRPHPSRASQSAPQAHIRTALRANSAAHIASDKMFDENSLTTQ